MIIILAFNSDYTSFYITDNLNNNQGKNVTFIDAIEERGKIMISLSTEEIKREYLYLVFYKNEKHEYYLYNYVFKYINTRNLKDYVDYKIVENEEITYKENIKESTIDCTFHKIDIDKTKANITYFFKVVNSDFYLTGEKSDSIAVMESLYYTVYQRNPISDDKGLITLTAKGDFKKWTILQVVAQIQQETILEYVTYKGKFIQRPKEIDIEEDAEGAESADTTLFFVVVGILLVLIIGLIVTIFIFKIKNQDLVEQVKHVSFQKTNSLSNNNNNVDKDNLIQRPVY